MTAYYDYSDEARDRLDRADLMFGHTDEDSAFLVDDYPYGFRLRTEIRYWIETNKKHGDRFVSQTRNPKTGAWNKPKKSTYLPVAVMYANAEGHVKYLGLNIWPNPAHVEHFMERAGDHLNANQRAQVAALVGWNKAYEGVTVEIVESTGWTAEQRAAHDAKQDEVHELLARRAGREAFVAKTQIIRDFGVSAS